jgi:Family of unknown function (DUF6308)
MPLHIAGDVVEDPMALWRKYAGNYGRTIHDYDLADPGSPSALTAEEAWRSRIIHSRLTYHERDQLVDRAADAPWAGVPASADLIDADPATPGGLFARAADLYWTFTWPERIHGVRVAKVHKVLHIKRPALYPILDERLRALYEPSAEVWLEPLGHLGELTTGDSPPYWAAFRDDLIRNHDALESYRDRLAREGDETVCLMARLTRLRLLDVLAWMVAGGLS